ncbi:hypothetical protein, partial [Aliarcobacter butzleri]
ILEDPNTPYFQKADYIGLCLQEINSKVEYIANDIKELQAYKKRLQTALTLAKELVADVLIQNGVDRVDGNVISSITLQSESITTKQEIVVLDENAVMTLGYVKFEPDIEAIKVALETPKGKKELKDIVTTITETSTNKAKVKVNAKKKSSSNEAITIELLSNDIDDDSLKDVA